MRRSTSAAPAGARRAPRRGRTPRRGGPRRRSAVRRRPPPARPGSGRPGTGPRASPRSAVQPLDALAVERVPGAAQQRGGLRAGQRQVARTELEHEVLRAQAGERQRRLRPGGEHERRPAREVVGDRAQGAHRRLAAQRVDVVEDEHERRLPLLADGIVHCARDARQQSPGVVVALVERDPGERPPVALGPLVQQRRLPVAGRRDERHQGRAVRGVRAPARAAVAGRRRRASSVVRARQRVEVPVRARPGLTLEERDGDHGPKHRTGARGPQGRPPPHPGVRSPTSPRVRIAAAGARRPPVRACSGWKRRLHPLVMMRRAAPRAYRRATAMTRSGSAGRTPRRSRPTRSCSATRSC